MVSVSFTNTLVQYQYQVSVLVDMKHQYYSNGIGMIYQYFGIIPIPSISIGGYETSNESQALIILSVFGIIGITSEFNSVES